MDNMDRIDALLTEYIGEMPVTKAFELASAMNVKIDKLRDLTVRDLNCYQVKALALATGLSSDYLLGMTA